MNKIIEQDIKEIISSDIEWERFRDKTILITGANGILPAYMVDTLLYLNQCYQLNITVLALVRNKDNAENRFQDYLQNTYLKIIVQDVIESIDYNNKVDFIIHAASQASPHFYKEDPVGTLKANILGTYQLLEFARNKNVESFLFFSSGEVYGDVPIDMYPIKETSFGYLDPVNVRSCYAESKRMGENMCIGWFSQFGVRTKIIRPFHTYGPGLKLNDGRVFADFVKNVLEDSNIIIRSDGLAKRAFCYITDAVRGYFKVLLMGQPGEAYNVGNPYCEVSIHQLARKIINLYPDKKLEVEFEILQDDSASMRSKILRSTPNVEKLISLGWLPTISVEVGFKRTIDSYL